MARLSDLFVTLYAVGLWLSQAMVGGAIVLVAVLRLTPSGSRRYLIQASSQSSQSSQSNQSKSNGRPYGRVE